MTEEAERERSASLRRLNTKRKSFPRFTIIAVIARSLLQVRLLTERSERVEVVLCFRVRGTWGGGGEAEEACDDLGLKCVLEQEGERNGGNKRKGNVEEEVGRMYWGGGRELVAYIAGLPVIK